MVLNEDGSRWGGFEAVQLDRRGEEEVVSPALEGGEVEALEEGGAGAEEGAVERGLVLAGVAQALVAEELVAEGGDVVCGAREELKVALAAQNDPVHEAREVQFHFPAGQRSRRNVHDGDRTDELLERQVRNGLREVGVLRSVEDVGRRVHMGARMQAGIQGRRIELVIVFCAAEGVDPGFRVAGVHFRREQVGRDVNDVHGLLLLMVS